MKRLNVKKINLKTCTLEELEQWTEKVLEGERKTPSDGYYYMNDEDTKNPSIFRKPHEDGSYWFFKCWHIDGYPDYKKLYRTNPDLRASSLEQVYKDFDNVHKKEFYWREGGDLIKVNPKQLAKKLFKVAQDYR